MKLMPDAKRRSHSAIERKRVKFFVAFCFVVFMISSSIANADEKTDQIDRLFARWDSTISPGAALAVIQEGQIIYKRGYGMANLEHNIPITPTSVFRIGSVSKQFTAACIVILAIKGNLGLDDDIRKYIPEIPRYDRTISIKHLIHHVSGIRDYLDLESISGKSDNECFTPQDTLQQLSRQRSLNFSPGDRYLYSNSGYFLLGVIVERVSGKSLNDFAREHIFEPLGMKNTHFQDDHTTIVKNRADGYSPSKDVYRIDKTTLDHVGDGSIFTTVEDLFLWDQAFYNHKLGKELMEILQTRGILNNGKKLAYAFGLRVGNYRGLRVVHHTGSYVGYRAFLVRFPEKRFSVICLANLSTISPYRLCHQVAEIYLADHFKDEPPKENHIKRETIILPAKELTKYSGNYQDETTDVWAVITAEKGGLTVRAEGHDYFLSPISETHFETIEQGEEVSIDFLRDESGEIHKANLAFAFEETSSYIKASPAPPLTPSQLQEYVGEYHNDEIPVMYRIVMEKGNLFLEARNTPGEPMRMMAMDKFALTPDNSMESFEFIRDKNKKVIGFNLSTDGIWNITFVKK